MNILFVGDVVGRPGRRVLRQRLAEIQEREAVDFTIVNVENSAGGFGVSSEICNEILELGVDVMTSGNHIWDKKEVLSFIDNEPRLLRPGNYPPGTPGGFSIVAESRKGPPVAVMNLQGRVFMPIIDCPFRLAEREIAELKKSTSTIVVDFHAEATSEKQAFGWFLDGKVSAVLGTHTHVPTADARVLPQGTAYVTDVGMTGASESVIGMRIESSLERFLTGRRAPFQVAKGSPGLRSVLLDIDEGDGRARSIRRIDLDEPTRPDHQSTQTR